MNFPGRPDIPEPLQTTAFVSGDEVAWPLRDCPSAIEWLRQSGLAILGIELWLVEDDGIRTSIRTKTGPAIYVSSCDRLAAEPWDDFVLRSAKEARDHVAAFRWPEDSLEPPQAAYFNLSRTDKRTFEQMKK